MPRKKKIVLAEDFFASVTGQEIQIKLHEGIYISGVPSLSLAGPDHLTKVIGCGSTAEEAKAGLMKAIADHARENPENYLMIRTDEDDFYFKVDPDTLEVSPV